MKISTRNIGRHITRFENAVREHAFIGSRHPADHPAIEREYKMAKANLKRFCIEAIIQEDSQ